MTKMYLYKLVIIAIVISFFGPLATATIINIPDDYPTIAEGIEASVNGDTVLVAPGEYWEVFGLQGKNILLTSSHGPDTTILHGGVVFIEEEDSSCIFRGFGIVGDGMRTCVQCGPNVRAIIIGNIIRDNSGMGISGVFTANSYALITNNIIKNNS